MARGTIKTKHSILIILSVIVLALNWASLHDIIKDNEPDFTAEYLIAAISSILFVSLLLLYIKKKIAKNN